MHGTAINPDTGKVAEYKELSACSDGTYWDEANGKEIGRLFQGLGPNSSMPEGTSTLFFIHHSQIPKHKNQPTFALYVPTDLRKPKSVVSAG
jgi:hypothetical protein